MSNGRLCQPMQHVQLVKSVTLRGFGGRGNGRIKGHDADFAVDRWCFGKGEIACTLGRKYCFGSHATPLLPVGGNAMHNYCLTVLNDWSRVCHRAS